MEDPAAVSEAPTPRPAARVLLLDPEHRVLMFRVTFDGRELWITPGGGVDEGETHEECALRELWEETGVRAAALGPCVWLRSHIFRWRQFHFDQQERFYLLQLTERPAVVYDNWNDEERRFMHDHRWWTVADIEASTAQFAPRELGRLLRELLNRGAPAAPVMIGV